LVAPLTGVLGNNDLGEREGLVAAAGRHGMTLVDPPLSLELGERRLLVAHDPRVLAGRDDFELALHGHTHRHSVVREAGRLVLNPGECAGHLPGQNSVGIVDLGGLEVEILRF
ncbi:MAG: metallophosphoesterase family protein, partial [Deltaproteobacteria bacterium]